MAFVFELEVVSLVGIFQRCCTSDEKHRVTETQRVFFTQQQPQVSGAVVTVVFLARFGKECVSECVRSDGYSEHCLSGPGFLCRRLVLSNVMEASDVTAVAVIGAGSMGHGIAEVAAVSGYDVTLRDVSEELVQDGYEQIEWSLEKLVEQDRLPESVATQAVDRVDPVVEIERAVSGADVILEAVPERMDIKREVYRELDEHTGDVVYATNTSTLSVTELSEVVDDPGRFCGMHFFNPPMRMPLVEVISGDHTREETLALAEDLTQSFDKTPIRVRKDVPGFVVNRVLVPLLNEAAWLVQAGDATVAEVDSTATETLGLPMGTFELCDQIGIDVTVDVLEYMHETLGDGYAPCPLFEEKVAAGDHGKKTGQGFYDWKSSGVDIPTDAARTDIAELLVGVAVNEASKLVAAGVADHTEIDEAVTLGAGFPNGPTQLSGALGYGAILDRLSTRQKKTDAARYEVTPILEAWVEAGGPNGSEGS